QHCSILQNLEIDNLSHILSLADCQFVFGNGFKCLKILILMQSQITADAVYNICVNDNGSGFHMPKISDMIEVQMPIALKNLSR
uniref:Uncharacterized protein n=1 Tax=Romanomermis culicivorax TaxID=13658 RepID=A0A915LCT6_ROMCU